MEKLPELLTKEDVMRILNIKSRYLYRLTHEKKIPFIKLGNKLRFEEKEIHAYLKRRRVVSE